MSAEEEEEEQLDNDAAALEAERARFDAMLRALEPTLCVIEVMRRGTADWFVLHSHAMRHRASIQAWVDETLSPVRYSLRASSYTGHETEVARGHSFSLVRTRPTLAIVREAYGALSCPRLTTFCSLVPHLVTLAVVLGALWCLVTL